MTKRELAARALHACGLGWVLRRLGSWNGLLVLNYHRIGDSRLCRWDEELYSATAECFDAQLRFFKSEFDVIHAGDLEQALRRNRGRFVQLTFDDGYRDNYEVAFPILRDHRISATFFLTTGFLDERPVPWWDELAWMVRGASRRHDAAFPESLASVAFDGPPPGVLRARREAVRCLNHTLSALSGQAQPRFLDAIGEATGTGRCPPREGDALWMTWDMVREMHRAGMTIGGHTVHHIELSSLPRDGQLDEIAGCKSRIEAEIGERIESFAYPFGQLTSFDAASRSCLTEAGFRFAYSYHGGYQHPGGADLHDLKRVGVENFQSHRLLMAISTLPRLLA